MPPRSFRDRRDDPLRPGAGLTPEDRAAIARIRRELEAEVPTDDEDAGERARPGRVEARRPGRSLALVAAFVLGCLAGATIGVAVTALYLLGGPPLATQPRP